MTTTAPAVPSADATTAVSRRAGLTRVRAVARQDLRILRSDPSFLVVFTVAPLAFVAFSTRSAGAALQVYVPGASASGAALVVPGATVVFSGFLVGNVGFGVFREHGWRTWERLRASPLSSAELVAGKSVVPLICLAFQLTVLLGGGTLLFDLDLRGGWALFLLVAVAFGLMQLAMGFMLLALCRSVMQLNAITNGAAMLVGGLAGAITPRETLPGWAQAIGPITPAYWAMRGFRAITIDGGGLGDVALPLLVLAGFTVLFAAVALARFDVEHTKVTWA